MRLPNIHCSETQDRTAFRGDELIKVLGGDELIKVLAIVRGERKYFRSQRVILTPNFSQIMFFWNPVFNQSSSNGKNLYHI